MSNPQNIVKITLIVDLNLMSQKVMFRETLNKLISWDWTFMIEKEFETGITYLRENSRVFRLLVDNLGKIKYKKRDVSFSAFVKLIISQ